MMAPSLIEEVAPPIFETGVKAGTKATVTAIESDIGDDISIETLRSLYQQNTVDPGDVVRKVYSRISAYHDKAVWISLVPEVDALKRANDLKNLYPQQEDRPPLYGIPFSVKDSIDIAGFLTTLACPSYAYTADCTAPVVQRLLDAGGILIGKTNLDQFATGLNGTRSPYGAPRCVRDADYISGGSSSGSVVSVAANLVSMTIATDTAGSTRVPSSLNGVIGLKPTLGTISTVGLVPACKTADCITIIAPTIESTLISLDAMQVYDRNDIYARDPQQLRMLAQQPRWDFSPSAPAIRYGLPPQELLDSVLCPEYASLFSRFLASLKDFNASLSSSFDYSPFAAANAMLYGSSVVSQRIVAFKDFLDTHDHDIMNPVVRSIFDSSSGFDAVKAYEDIFALKQQQRLAYEQFDSQSCERNQTAASSPNLGIDVLVVPSTTIHPTVEEMFADPLELNKRLGSFTHFVNLLDLCAVAIPLNSSQYTWRSKNGNDMPFGVTLISLPGRDRDLLELGRRVMEVAAL